MTYAFNPSSPIPLYFKRNCLICSIAFLGARTEIIRFLEENTVRVLDVGEVG
jgi:hypothetical protein